MIFNVSEHIDMIRNGTKTQTRRLNRELYYVGSNYAVQRRRGVKAELDIRIVMDRIWFEIFWIEFEISKGDAIKEGGYIPANYEHIFRELNPNWNQYTGRWAFEFHVIEVQK